MLLNYILVIITKLALSCLPTVQCDQIGRNFATLAKF